MEKGFTIQCNVCGETVTVSNMCIQDKGITAQGNYGSGCTIECRNCGQEIDL